MDANGYVGCNYTSIQYMLVMDADMKNETMKTALKEQLHPIMSRHGEVGTIHQGFKYGQKTGRPKSTLGEISSNQLSPQTHRRTPRRPKSSNCYELSNRDELKLIDTKRSSRSNENLTEEDLAIPEINKAMTTLKLASHRNLAPEQELAVSLVAVVFFINVMQLFPFYNRRTIRRENSQINDPPIPPPQKKVS